MSNLILKNANPRDISEESAAQNRIIWTALT
jgi:hypothetical protein